MKPSTPFLLTAVLTFLMIVYAVALSNALVSR